MKVAPSPSPGLVTAISPFSSLAISRLIERPRPVPPKRREIEPSACWKASKISLSLSGGIPMPVSETAKSTAPSLGGRHAQRHAAGVR